MNNLKLWYDGPALNWQQGLPLGNGRIGAVVIAATHKEVWCMTEVTYWSGESESESAPLSASESASRTQTDGRAHLDLMRQHFFAGDVQGGDKLAKQYLQPEKKNFGTNLSLCDVFLEFGNEGMVQDFRRELNLDQAVSTSSYQMNGSRIMREMLASHADDVVAAKFWSEEPGGVCFSLGLKGRTPKFQMEIQGNDTFVFSGKATEGMHSDGTCGVLCQGIVKVVAASGSVAADGERIMVHGADEAFVYFAVNTDYRKSGELWREDSRNQVDQAAAKGYERLKSDHAADYASMYGRVKIDLPRSENSCLPTDERIRLFKNGQTNDPEFIALFFQYGRYLMIAGSRGNSPLPLHLQGIWNDGEANRMAWSCDYHLDVNTEMNYYPTEIVNLGESHLPLMKYIEDLSVAGRRAASHFYGCAGWVAHVFSNAWGFTAPGWETTWGLNVTGGLWIAYQMIEHYDYSLDRNFLEQQAYPVLKEAAAFFMDYMTIHPKYGWLVTGPSNSPENSFYTGKPEEGEQQLSMGPTMDQVLVRDLLEFCLKAARELNTDVELQREWERAISLLPPLQIGKRGQVQEWLEDYEEAQPEHRHLSHLFALYPSDQITPKGTPELSAAARVTLENRMARQDLEDVEFTAALFGLYFARLHDGDRALKYISHLIGELCLGNMLSYSKSGIAGAEANIFVIDGNFGGTAAVAELLLQSHAGELHLLPALPGAWRSGSVQGLRAKGNMEADIVWKDGELVSATIKAFASGTTVIHYRDWKTVLALEPGSVYNLDKSVM